jgi:hypothetical protein
VRARAERGRGEDHVTVYPSHIVFEVFRDSAALSEALRSRFVQQDALLVRLHLLGYHCAVEGLSDVQCLLCHDPGIGCEAEDVVRSENAARLALAAIRAGAE